MFGQIFHINISESSQPDVEGDESHINTFYLKPFYQLAGKVHACRGCRNCALVFGKNSLKAFFVFGFNFTLDVFWQGGFAKGFNNFIKGFGIAIK